MSAFVRLSPGSGVETVTYNDGVDVVLAGETGILEVLNEDGETVGIHAPGSWVYGSVTDDEPAKITWLG